MNKPLIARIFPLGIIFVILLFLMPRDSKFPYDYRAGREWRYETLFAEFDFPIYKTEEELRNDRSASAPQITPYYKYSDDITAKTINAAEALDLGNLRRAVLSELRSIYNRGVIADESRRSQGNTPDSDVIFVQKDKRSLKYPLAEIYSQSDAKSKMLSDLSELTDINVDSLLRVSGVYNLIVPNVIYDEQTTELVRAESVETISLTSGFVNAGECIVSNGELVTEDVKQLLDSYKKEYEANVGYLGTPFLLWLGNALILAAIVVLFYFIIYFGSPRIFNDTRYPFVMVVFALFSILTLIILRINEDLLFALPFTLGMVMLRSFLRDREVLPIYMVTLAPMLICHGEGAVLFLMFLVAGLVGIFTFKYFQRGWKQFIASMINFVVLVLLLLAFRAADLLAGNAWGQILALFISSILTVAAYPLLYLFEKLFNLVSDSRLIELADTSNDIVRVLEQKAPGTFQHSLQVMNMAETVARAIAINPELVRVGALYHDIGKINNPLCFVENESLLTDESMPKYHSDLTPLQSAKDIIKHVDDGLELARKHRLPQLVQDFIRSHHGTSYTKFFYDKFVREGGDPAMISEFRYDGFKPKTKAQIVLMLCDSIEAASRTLRGKTPEAYSEFVESIVAAKMNDGQLDDVELTIGELKIVKETLKTYLAQLNHQRVSYSNNRENK